RATAEDLPPSPTQLRYTSVTLKNTNSVPLVAHYAAVRRRFGDLDLRTNPHTAGREPMLR
ncbi:MAG: hypothetical protein OXM02_11555, partial [Bacteroidota bacterium]|nr:hypothetical protein [Bacteroidota bacterium]MDE2957789.1 hypothetical protein [Bacteroidota bacterium]